MVIIYAAVLFYMLFKQTQRSQDKKEKKRYTIELCMKDDNEYVNILLNDKLPYYKQVENEIDLSSESNTLKILSYFEKIAIGITNRIYDEEIITQYYKKYFITFYDHYKYTLRQYRNKQNLPFLYINFEKYVNKWISNSPDRNNNKWRDR